MRRRPLTFCGGLLCLLAAALPSPAQETASAKEPVTNLEELESLDWQLPNEKLMRPFAQRRPIYFVTRTQNIQDWLALPTFWNEFAEEATDPRSGAKVTRQAVKIKVPLGQSQAPKVPPENELSVDRWLLGRKLYFDPVLSSNNTMSCASCHDPELGWTDQSPVSIGIFGKKGGVSAPPVMNAAYNLLQFWDGRAVSLEDQAQGPPQNALEMFSGDGHAWRDAVRRVRKNPEYVDLFQKAYGTEPTRDAVAKAIGCFERTVLSGNAVYDRADFAKAIRAAEEGVSENLPKAVDYETVLKQAFAAGDGVALKALKLDPAKDQDKVPAVAERLFNGQQLYFGKARCNSCHVGDNFTDNQFHNLGVGVNKEGQIPANGLGRYAALPTGAKDPAMVGAFKTPMLRGLLDTAPYMHDGSEKTLEEVVEFYDRGGNPNRYLAPKMRDFDAEKAFLLARAQNKEYTGPKAYVFGPDDTPVVPLKLNLTAQEKSDLVLFLRALQGDPVDPVVANPERMPPGLSARKE